MPTAPIATSWCYVAPVTTSTRMPPTTSRIATDAFSEPTTPMSFTTALVKSTSTPIGWISYGFAGTTKSGQKAMIRIPAV